MFILLLFYYWLQVSASKGHHQASTYKKRKCWCIYIYIVHDIVYSIYVYVLYSTICTSILRFFVNIGLMMAF